MLLPVIARTIWFPNTFTPDAEINNRFGCTPSIELADYELTVYNRRGQVVYSSTDAKATWDGTCDGTPVPQGTYVYRWFATDVTGQRDAGRGTVTLLR